MNWESPSRGHWEKANGINEKDESEQTKNLTFEEAEKYFKKILINFLRENKEINRSRKLE